VEFDEWIREVDVGPDTKILSQGWLSGESEWIFLCCCRLCVWFESNLWQSFSFNAVFCSGQ